MRCRRSSGRGSAHLLAPLALLAASAGAGPLNFEQTQRIELGPGDSIRPATSAAWGDLDGDGDLDLVIGAFRVSPDGRFDGHELIFYRNVSGQGFVTWQTVADALPNGPGIAPIAVGDIDRDGDADIVLGGLRRAGADEIVVLRNTNGLGQFDREVLIGSSSLVPGGVGGYRELILTDLDADGWIDFVGAPHVGPTVIAMNNGAGVLGYPQNVLLGQGFRDDLGYSLTPVDISGDGLVDIVTGGGRRGGRNGVILRQSTRGVFESEAAPDPLALSYAAIDVDLDGRTDLIPYDPCCFRGPLLANNAGAFDAPPPTLLNDFIAQPLSRSAARPRLSEPD